MPSHPTEPSLKYPPREVIIGGFVIDNHTCAAWGSRILGKFIDPKINAFRAYSLIRRKLLKEYKTKFTPIGEEIGLEDSEWMVVTQSAKFRGWKDMDPMLIPQFKETEREAIARKLLEEEGVMKYRFATVLY